MSKKYVIEIKPEYENKIRGVTILGAKNNNLYVDSMSVDELEELNSDYINEHYGDMQDDAYERGHGIGYQQGYEDGKKEAESSEHIKSITADAFNNGMLFKEEKIHDAFLRGVEKGKAVNDKGCDGCKYQANRELTCPCFECANNYKNQWKAKDDKIVVGDEVAFHHDDGRPDTVVVVTYIGQDGFIDGMDGRGTQYAHKNPTKWTKTGRHFDIDKILDEMKGNNDK